MEWKRPKECHLGPWPLRSKLGLALSNGYHIDGTHNEEVVRLRIGDREMANDLHDSRKKDKLIIGRRIPIDIYKGEYEVRGKVYGNPLNEGQQKLSTMLSNGVIVRQWIKNKCDHHVKEMQIFCKSHAMGVLTVIPR